MALQLSGLSEIVTALSVTLVQERLSDTADCPFVEKS